MIGKLLPFRRQPEELSDEALVSACASGDTAALGALFDRYHADVHRFLQRLSGVDDHSTDDLSQETFLRAREAAPRFRREAAVRTWLLGIAANVARRHVRSEVRHKARSAAYLTRLGSVKPTPAEDAERAEMIARLRRGVAALPHDLRVAFLLCDVEGERGVDVARALNLREGTLYRRLHEARGALRSAIEGRLP